MAHQDLANTSQHASSTGQAFTGSGWLDVHFEAYRPEYEAMLRSVPIELGWHVLDAGCGSGSFLPLLAGLVGRSGEITAVDLAPDNVAVVQQRLAGWDLPASVRVRIGSLVDLPFPAGSFDAVWCSNVTQYLTDAELSAVLREFRRVVRPGGLVAVKDTDTGSIRTEPAPAYFSPRSFEARWRASPQAGFLAPGGSRGPTLPAWLREAGYAEVWARSTLIERWAPLRPVEQEFYRAALGAFADQALELDLPVADLALWRELNDPARLAAFVAHPNFYMRGVQTVAVGRVFRAI